MSSDWREAVDVLGDPELRDPALLGHLAVALGVAGGEVLLGGRVVLVGAQVDVVVGQHAAGHSGPAARFSVRPSCELKS